MTVTVVDPARAYDVSFVLDLDRATDNIAVEQLTVCRRPAGREVTTSAMRHLPLDEWQVRAVRLAARGEAPASEADARTGMAKDEYARWRRPKPIAKQLRMSDEVLEDVGHVYRRAVELGDNPTNVVGNVFAKPRNTAGRWVLEARKRGFLEPVASTSL